MRSNRSRSSSRAGSGSSAATSLDDDRGDQIEVPKQVAGERVELGEGELAQPVGERLGQRLAELGIGGREGVAVDLGQGRGPLAGGVERVQPPGSALRPDCGLEGRLDRNEAAPMAPDGAGCAGSRGPITRATRATSTRSG